MKLFKKAFSLILSFSLSVSLVMGSYVDVGASELPKDEPLTFTSRCIEADNSSSEETYWKSMSSKFYYNQLDDKSKRLYDRIDAAYMQYLLNDNDIQSIKVKYSDLGVSESGVEIIGLLLFFESPQYFFANGAFNCKDGEVTCGFYSEFASGSVRAKAKADIKEKVNEYINLTKDYSKVEDKEHAVFLRMCENLTPAEQQDIQTLYGILEDKTFSTGYMALFSAVMNAIGIDCVGVAGKGFAWNAVCVHGFWYYVDSYNCDIYADVENFGIYWLYNQNCHKTELYTLFSIYRPEIKYDCVAGNAHTSRYFSDNDHTYFIVSDCSGTGYYASPISGSFETCPSSITYNNRTYQMIKAPTQPEPYIPSDTDVKIDEKNFPDPVFRQYVKDVFDDGNDYLSLEERNKVWNIEIEYTDLADLTGIGFFPELEWLIVDNNKLKSLDLSKNSKISQMHCSNNQITTLDISKVTYYSTCFKNDNFFKYRDKVNGFMQYNSADGEKQIVLVTDVACKLICDGIEYDPLTDPELNALDEPIVDPEPMVPTESDKAFWKSMSSDFYYRQLSKNEKKLYDRLDKLAIERLFSNKTIYSSIYADASDLGLSSSEVYHVAFIFRISNPQYFFLDSAFAYSDDGVGILIGCCGKGQDRLDAREKIKKEIQEYLKAASAYSRPEEKEKAIVDLMCQKIEYEHNFYDQNMYGAVKGNCVCAGYMMLFSALMNACGITCVSITTYAHGFNIINLHGNWYYVDVTFSDQYVEGYLYPFVDYQYYNMNKATQEIDDFLVKYLPEVKYDCLASDTYSKRYFTSGGVTYFVVNEPAKGNGLAQPIDGSTSSLPATVKYNNRTYTVISSQVDTNEYKVTLKNPVNGKANVSKGVAHCGDYITVTFTPDEGYDLYEIRVNGDVISGTEFVMPDKDVEVEAIFAKHDIKEIPQKNPTCTEPGYEKYYKCSRCGKIFSDPDGKNEIAEPVEIAPLGHEHILHEGKEATCTDAGYEAYYECSRCHKLFTDAKCENEIKEPVVIPKLGHKLKEIPEQAPTKTEPGHYAYYECERCGKFFSDPKGENEIKPSDMDIPVMTHDLTHVSKVPATCTEAGCDEYYICKDPDCNCGKLYRDKYGQNEVEQKDLIIPALGHDPVRVDGKAATCTEAGYEEYYKCSRCNQLFSDANGTEPIKEPKLIPALGHDKEHLEHHEAKDATYLKDGNIEYYLCPRCKKYFTDAECTNEITYEQTIVPAIGAAKLGETAEVGDFSFKVTNPATDGTGTVSLNGVAELTPYVSIPATVEIKEVTYKVTRIESNTFNGNKTIRTLYIGANIAVIDGKAFYGCSNLTKVSGGAGLMTIGSYAFAKCPKLSSFKLSSKVLAKIGTYTFSGDKKLKTLYIKYTTKLTKSGVKKSLKGSKVKTVKVMKSKVKAYKKYFKKKNCGRKVKVKK